MKIIFSAMSCKWQVHFVYEQACGERRLNPRYLTKGRKKQETIYINITDTKGNKIVVKYMKHSMYGILLERNGKEILY